MRTWQVLFMLSLAVLLKVSAVEETRSGKDPHGKVRSYKKKAEASYDPSDLPENRRIYLKIKGQSGKFTISRKSNPSADKNRIDISFEEIGEVDSGLNAVGRTGSAKHYFQSFATLDFFFTDFENGTYQDTIVDQMFFTADLPTVNAKFIVTVLVFKEDANITVDGESTEVKQGDVKLNFYLENWSFCDGSNSDNACRQGSTNQVGSYVKFVYSQKSKGKPQKRGHGAKKRKTDGDEYDLGGDGILILSLKVKVDDVWENMTSGYPKYEEQGSKQKFTFLFPKFTSNVTYDPVYSASTVDPVDEGAGAGGYAPAGPVALVSVMGVTWLLSVIVTRIMARV